MGDRVRPYLFYDTAISICSTCLRRVDAKIVFEDGNVFLIKRCASHGVQKSWWPTTWTTIAARGKFS
jgi:uncharacterized radical SAM superfamily Fe-S cluster-containing enzyme